VRASIAPYLRSLWNATPPLHDIAAHEVQQALLSPLGMHLPIHAPHDLDASTWLQAAAAHAAAHLVYSRHQFSLEGLRPVSQALVGLLEDARVEWLACQELPGLRRLWLQFHTVQHTNAPTFEELMRRLARALLELQHQDAHPWVLKGRALFFTDTTCSGLALTDPLQLRQAASRLGNDIGQMRLQFNARLYRVAPSYRDDNHHLWQPHPARADVQHDVSAQGQGAGLRSGQASAAAAAQPYRYREWDRQVPVYRANWCTVLDTLALPATQTAPLPPAMRGLPPVLLPTHRVQLPRQTQGEELDLDALVHAQVSVRSGHAPEPHVYRRTLRTGYGDATVLLIDVSASTARALPGQPDTMLHMARTAAWQCAQALQRQGLPCAIHSFCSDGRHAVHYQRVKDFDEPLGAHSLSRLMGLHSHLSTRLGAALRHACHVLKRQGHVPLRVLLLTDGQPHDVDVHDPRYLAADALKAVQEAARVGICVQCLTMDPTSVPALKRIFGPGHVQALTNVQGLAMALGKLARNTP